MPEMNLQVDNFMLEGNTKGLSKKTMNRYKGYFLNT